jgi:hypothetical protein
MKNTPMVCITWYDAKDGQTGWHSVEDIKKESLATCYSVGWLVRKTDERTIIMSDYSKVDNDEDGGRHIAIPTGWVKKIEYLKVDYANV